MNLKSQFFLVLVLVLAFKATAFQRLIFKSFTEPSNTEIKDFWEIQDPNGNNASINDYLSCNNEKFFGPFESNTRLNKFFPNYFYPNRVVKGQFELLILNQEQNSIQWADQIEITFDDKLAHLDEMVQLERPITQCNQIHGSHSIYQIKFTFTKGINANADQYDSPWLNILVHLNNDQTKWAIKKFFLDGNFCKWDCLLCESDEIKCSACHPTSYLINNNCECRLNQHISSITPLACAIITPNTQLEDRCFLEYSRFVTQAYYTPTCETAVDKSENTSLQCTVSNTIGFPISDICFQRRIIELCSKKAANTSKCLKLNQTERSLSKLINTQDQTIFFIPTSEINLFAYNISNYQPNIEVWNLNFELIFNHLNNTVNKKNKPFKNFTWKTVVMNEQQEFTIFDLYEESSPYQINTYFCTDISCSQILKQNLQMQKLYFRVFSDKIIKGYTIEVTRVKQINEQTKSVYDLRDTVVLEKQFGNNDQIYSMVLNGQGSFDQNQIYVKCVMSLKSTEERFLQMKINNFLQRNYLLSDFIPDNYQLYPFNYEF